MSFHVKRTRTRDEREDIVTGMRPSRIGEVRHSKTFPTAAAAQCEAAAWESTGTWTTEVVPGPSPRGVK